MMGIASLASQNIRNKDQLLHRLTSTRARTLPIMTCKTGKLSHFDA
jgi:hypothetical protein